MAEKWTAEAAQQFLDDVFAPWIKAIGLKVDEVTETGLRMRLPQNADLMKAGRAYEAAGELASALHAEKLILLTDVEGVKDAGGELLRVLTRDEAAKHIEEGTIREGMIPKVECCIAALRDGVPRAHIIDGRIQHALLLEIFTDGGVGTLLSH